MVVMFSRIGQMSPADSGSKAWMSRSDMKVVAAVAPRLLDRVFGGGVEVVLVQTLAVCLDHGASVVPPNGSVKIPNGYSVF